MDFTQLLSSALGNPSQRANPDDMTNILGTVQRTASQHGANPAIAPTLLSTVGSFVRSALNDRRRERGPGEAEALVDRYGGLQPNPQAVESLFSPQEQARLERSVSQETGLQANVVQAMLPLLVPLVLKFLQGGSPAQAGGAGTNSLLSSFMDADRDGDVDIGDALRMVQGFKGF